MKSSVFYSKDDKRQVTFYTSDKLYQKFKERYPYMSAVFFNRALKKACQDKEFFDSVIFSNLGDDLNADV